MNIITLFLLSLNCLFASAFTNLARNGTATASSIEPGSNYIANNAIDGDKTTRWASKENSPEWIVVDLGSKMKINKVDILWEKAFAKEFEIQISSDGKNYEKVLSYISSKDVILKEDLDNEEDNINTQHEFDPKEARYVRIYCTKKGTLFGYSIYELEIYNTSKEKTESKEKSKSDDDNDKVIKYGIIGGVALLCLILLALIFKRKGKRDRSNESIVSTASLDDDNEQQNIVDDQNQSQNQNRGLAQNLYQTQTQNQNQNDVINSTNMNAFSNIPTYNYQDPMAYMQNSNMNPIDGNYYNNNNVNNINNIQNGINSSQNNYQESLANSQNYYNMSQNLNVPQNNYNGCYVPQNGNIQTNVNMTQSMSPISNNQYNIQNSNGNIPMNVSTNQLLPPILSQNQYNNQNPNEVNNNRPLSNASTNNENLNNGNSTNSNVGASGHSERGFNKAMEAELDRARNHDNDDKPPEYSVN
ncbi:hypothetical protein H8356DRAFT_1302257 [Neocallimastix lanati (nom. inval.)]|nr:hypothetical protein H8356DRAFT_1302257 [Neocallimastix sp. JGI-2020a]